MNEYLKFKNISTIITSILLTIFGLVLGYLSSIGFNLPVTADMLATVVGGVILGVFSYYNAKNPNTLFDEESDTIYIPVDDLSTIQVKAINNILENCVENMQHECNCENKCEND